MHRKQTVHGYFHESVASPQCHHHNQFLDSPNNVQLVKNPQFLLGFVLYCKFLPSSAQWLSWCADQGLKWHWSGDHKVLRIDLRASICTACLPGLWNIFLAWKLFYLVADSPSKTLIISGPGILHGQLKNLWPPNPAYWIYYDKC